MSPEVCESSLVLRASCKARLSNRRLFKRKDARSERRKDKFDLKNFAFLRHQRLCVKNLLIRRFDGLAVGAVAVGQGVVRVGVAVKSDV